MIKYSIFPILLVLLTSTDTVVNGQLSCMDEDGKSVDWYIALKYPGNYKFVYMSSNNIEWTSSQLNLSSHGNMIDLTIRQSYDLRNFYAYYNDEPPNSNLMYNDILDLDDENYFERGHLKGVVNFDQSSGYWLIHSVPKFPAVKKYKYRHREKRFAQSFICVTVGVKDLPAIVQQLLMMTPGVYSHNIPSNFSNDTDLMEDLRAFVHNKIVRIAISKDFSFASVNGKRFNHFGKSGDFEKDLYASLIAPSLKTSLYVETWIRQDRINSSCNRQYKVYNVDDVFLVDTQFREGRDHSKWAVSTSASEPVVCIGDINRMSSQFIRGGGSMCFSDGDVWNIFKGLVAKYERC